MSPDPVLRVLAWPVHRTGNPYTADLYGAMARVAPGRVLVEELRWSDAWRHRPDVVHVHWPEAAVASPSRIRAGTKVAVVLLTLAWLRRRGAAVVWTCHNLRSHEGHHPWLEARLRRGLLRLLDGVVHLSPGAVEEAATTIPGLAAVPTAVVRHGIAERDRTPPPARAEARVALGLGPSDLVLLAAGAIRPYKRVPDVLRAVAAAGLPGARVVVAGRPVSPELGREVQRAAAEVPGTVLRLGWIADDELARCVAAADAVLCPYAELHNSGVVVSALARDRPVVARRSASTEDLRHLAGDDWVELLDGPLSGEALRGLESWLRRARPTPPDLSALDPEVVATQVLAALEAFAGRRPAPGPRANENVF